MLLKGPNKTGTGTLTWCKSPGFGGERWEPVPVLLGVLKRASTARGRLADLQ